MKAFYYILLFPIILWSCQDNKLLFNTQLQVQQADSIRKIGGNEHTLGNYHLALQHYYDALSAYSEIQDSANQAFTLNVIGILNSNLDDPNTALFYYKKALLMNNNKNEIRKAQIINNMAIEYLENNQYEYAINSFNQSITIKKQAGFNPTEYNYANLGRVYLKQGNIDSALYYLTLSKEALQNHKSKRPKNDSMEILKYFGQALVAKHEYSKAKEYFETSYHIAKSVADKSFIESNSDYLSIVYEILNNPDSALKYSQIKNTYSDSLFREKNLKTIAKIETKYELLQLEKQNLEKLNKRNNIIYLTVCIATLLLLLTIVVISSYLRSKKTSRLLQLKNEEISNQKIQQLLQENEIKSIKSNIEGQEKERKRIAEELHDGIGGSLSGIKLALLNLNDQNKTEAAYNKVAANIDQVCAEVRTISHNLIPPDFEQAIFINILQQYFHQFSSNTKIKLEYQLHSENELNALSRTFHIALYRIIQEALNNIKKHAQATSIEIQLLIDQDDINLIIEDNGVGFDTDKITPGIGLKNISSRVNLLNGTIDIDSKVNRGTIINIDFNKTADKDGK